MQRARLLERVRNHPGNVTFDDLESLLLAYGFELKRIRGSHHAYRKGRRTIIVARHGSHVHSDAVREVLSAIGETDDAG